MVIDSYSETNYGADFEIWSTGGRYQVSQSFTGNGNVLGRVQAYLSKLGSPSGNITAFIYAHTGTYGTSSLPTGSPLATSATVNANTLSSSSHSLVDFTFSGANQITLVNGTKYVIVIDFESGDGSNTVKVGMDASSPTHSGNAGENDSRFGGWTARNGDDLIFYVYSTGSSPSASLSPSASQSPSASVSLSASPSSSISASPSPSPMPILIQGVLKVAKPGVDVLRNSDIDKLIFSSEFGTLKYFTKQAVSISFDASTGDISAIGSYQHGLGYYPFCEVYVSVNGGAYEYCPFFGSGATVAYSANVKIDTDKIWVYGEISGVSASTWTFDFIIFVYKNDLGF